MIYLLLKHTGTIYQNRIFDFQEKIKLNLDEGKSFSTKLRV